MAIQLDGTTGTGVSCEHCVDSRCGTGAMLTGR